MSLPIDNAPVLARIWKISDLGESHWWEVVYYCEIQGSWQSFSDSDTFDDGEVVLCWCYCTDVPKNLFNRVS